jgi:hypothetical protein
MLSALSRVLPGMGLDPKLGDNTKNGPPPPPLDPFDPAMVEEWQMRSQAPAAFRPPSENRENEGVAEGQRGELSGSRGGAAVMQRGSGAQASVAPLDGSAVSPSNVLIQPESPGPEGIAEQFAFKVASAVFDTDISPVKQPVGMATHLSYGSFWGAVFGLFRPLLHTPVAATGAVFGLGVWAVGPATLVPAMKLMGKPTEEPPLRTVMMILGHVAYGIAVAGVYEAENRS